MRLEQIESLVTVKVYQFIFLLDQKKKKKSIQWDETQRLVEEDEIRRSTLIPESDVSDKASVLRKRTRLPERNLVFIQVHTNISFTWEKNFTYIALGCLRNKVEELEHTLSCSKLYIPYV